MGDKFLHQYSGQEGSSLAGSMAIGGALSAIFLASGTLRAAFGTGLGLRAGYKIGARAFESSEQKKAKSNLENRIKKVSETFDCYPGDKSLNHPSPKNFRNALKGKAVVERTPAK